MALNLTFRFPRVDPQLQSGTPTEGEDCAFQCVRGAIRWATDGADTPSIKDLRTEIGIATGGMALDDARDLIRAHNVGARFTNVESEVTSALMIGGTVILAINYGWLNDYRERLSGDHAFEGLHAIMAHGWETPISGAHWVADLDPLFDGRRNYPEGLVMTRWRWLRDASRACGNGFQAVIIQHN